MFLRSSAFTLAVLVAASVSDVAAQPPGFTPPYPQRETDPAAVERGRQVYEGFGCSFCHGADIRGAAGGPSLLRSPLVQNDVAGELIGDVIVNGVPGTAMAAFMLDRGQIADVAEFLNSFELSSRDRGQIQPETIVTGNPRAGRRFFAAHCADCHSVDGDLAGLARRVTDPRALQQRWLMPRNAPPIVASIATATGTERGALLRIDEFLVTIALPDGRERTFERNGDSPRVVLDDPLAAHKALLTVYEDRDIHNVTAYLVAVDEERR